MTLAMFQMTELDAFNIAVIAIKYASAKLISAACYTECALAFVIVNIVCNEDPFKIYSFIEGFSKLDVELH